MSYGNEVEEKEDIETVKCPYCGTIGNAHIMRDYTGYHERECLIHCDNPECDRLYIIVYKFSHIVELVPKTIKF